MAVIVGLQAVAGGKDADAPLSSGTLFDGLNRDTISTELNGVEGEDYVAGEVLTIFSREATSSEALEALAAAGLSVDSEDLEAALAAHDFCIAHTADSKISVATALEAIKAQDTGTIQYAEANYTYHLIDTVYDSTVLIDTSDIEIVSEDPNEMADSTDIGTFTKSINDPYSTYQWHLGAINAYDAWDVQKTQDNPVSVAVIDTGIMAEHEDLKDRIVARYNATLDGGTVEDVDGHGTHVAGIIAATSNNGIGLSGVSYNADLMPIRVFESDGSGALYSLIRAYEWLLEDADSNGIADKVEQDNLRVVNMSLGGYGQISNVFRTLIQEAYDQGILTVCASGNDGINGVDAQTRCWPADYEPSMSVIALDQGISRAYYSNYGSDKDIAAPGSRICSTYLASGSSSAGAYGYMSGSSMATPVVAGVAALVYANGLAIAQQNDDEESGGVAGYDAAEVRDILEETAIDIGDPGYDVETAWGCVDAEAALKASARAHTVTINAGEHATLFCNGEEVAGGTTTETVMPGEKLTGMYTVTPDEGYEFTCFVDDGGDGYANISDCRILYDVTFTAVSVPREDTKTTLELVLNDKALLQPTLVLSPSEGVAVTVDWGDGSAAETISDDRAGHTYASTGNYLVTITLTSGGSYMLGDGKTPLLARDYVNSLVEVSAARNAVPGAFSFAGCEHLAVADLSSCTTAGVTDMSSMFEGCGALADLTFPDSGLDTSAVTSMQSMFAGCHSLTSIDLSSFDTSNVTSMEAMFQYCPYIETLDLSSFDTRQVVSMACCFQDCDALSDIKFSKNFKTSSVTDISRLFYGCTHLPELDLSSFNTKRVENMAETFTGCQSLKELDLSSFDTSQVTDMKGMFLGCSSLTSLDVSGFDTSRVTSMDSMFASCYDLSVLDLSKSDTSQLRDMDALFQGCKRLKSVDLSGFDTSNVVEMRDCFYYCVHLQTVILGDGFSFCGGAEERLCSVPSKLILSDSDTDMAVVEWEDEKTGVTYPADDVPNNVAATYNARVLISDSDFGSSDGSEGATDDTEANYSANDSASSVGDDDEVATEPGPVIDGSTPDVGKDTDNGDDIANGGDTANDGNADEDAIGGTVDSSDGAASGSTDGSTGSKAAKKQTIKLSKTTMKLKRGGKQVALRASGVKTKLAFKANKVVEKALKIKVRGKNKITVKATKKAQRGKTYRIKVWARKGSSYQKSNVVTLRVKVS